MNLEKADQLTTQPSPEKTQEFFDLKTVELDIERILFEEDPDGYFAFTTETQIEGRKIGYEIGKAIFLELAGNQYESDSDASLLQRLTNPELIEDCRIDGNQLSFSEEYNKEYDVWEILIFQRYATTNSEDNKRLRTAIQKLGFFVI